MEEKAKSEKEQRDKVTRRDRLLFMYKFETTVDSFFQCHN